MIIAIEKTRDNIMRIASEYGIGEMEFMSLLKRKNLVGQFDPDKWALYIEAITRFPPCPLCGGDQKCYNDLAGIQRSPRGLGCRINKSHFFISHLGVRFVQKEWPDKTYEQAIEWIKENWEEVVLDAFGNSSYKKQCVEINGKYYPRSTVDAESAITGGVNTVI